jgi:hypothetical protein
LAYGKRRGIFEQRRAVHVFHHEVGQTRLGGGIAKLTLPLARWPSAFDSFFFPIMGGNIAQSWALKLAVVLHFCAITFIGYMIWKFLAGEIRRFQTLAALYVQRVDSELQAVQSRTVVDVLATSQVRPNS